MIYIYILCFISICICKTNQDNLKHFSFDSNRRVCSIHDCFFETTELVAAILDSTTTCYPFRGLLTMEKMVSWSSGAKVKRFHGWSWLQNKDFSWNAWGVPIHEVFSNLHENLWNLQPVWFEKLKTVDIVHISSPSWKRVDTSNGLDLLMCFSLRVTRYPPWSSPGSVIWKPFRNVRISSAPSRIRKAG